MSSVSSNTLRPSTVGKPSLAASRGSSEVLTKTNKPPKSAGPHPKHTKKSNKPSADQLRAKEEEYLRINAELEAKTSELVKEAEELLKGDLSVLVEDDRSSHPHSPRSHIKHDAHSPTHTKHSPHTLLSNYLDDNDLFTTPPEQHTTQRRPSTTSGVSQSPGATQPLPSAQVHVQSSLEHGYPHSKPASSTKGGLHFKLTQPRPHSKSRSRQISGNGSIPVADSIRGEVGSVLERGRGVGGVTADDDILPEVAEDMGPEATIRFLKAKLRVMQEEMDRLCQENREKEKSLTQAVAKLKEVSEQAAKIGRSHQSMTSQVDKYRTLSETLKHKCEGLETQLVSLRKEVESMKGSQKKAASQQNTVEVRLNRALEDTEKYKAALQKARADMKDTSKLDRQKVEQLTSENKQLERQKTELIAAFKKQMKLIDILKRQKMHIEAAKMLSFTEEEFVKALDWGSS